MGTRKEGVKIEITWQGIGSNLEKSQYCIIFCSSKSVKRQELPRKGYEPVVKDTEVGYLTPSPSSNPK